MTEATSTARVLFAGLRPSVKLELLLSHEGHYDIEVEPDLRRVFARVVAEPPELLVLALDEPEGEGEELLHALFEHPASPEIVIVSGKDDVDLAVRAMKLGVHDYLGKPIDGERLLATLGRAVERRWLREDARELAGEREGERSPPLASIVSRAPQMRALLRHAATIAASDDPVLLWGEAGTGKGLLARAIHELSPRSDGPFVTVNATVFAAGLFASGLLPEGAAEPTTADAVSREAVASLAEVLEEARGGTLLLDEIGELALSVQVRLLRALQEGEQFRVAVSANAVDVRLITATNKNLQEQIRRGHFRRDLFYRLNVCSLFVPPLRDREGDLPLLAQIFLDRAAQRYGKGVSAVSEDVLELMSRYAFPGNVRELENLINNGVRIEGHGELTRKAMPQYFLQATLRSRYTISDVHGKSISQVEKEHIERVLTHTGSNRSAAARILGISRVSLISKIKQYKIDL